MVANIRTTCAGAKRVPCSPGPALPASSSPIATSVQRHRTRGIREDQWDAPNVSELRPSVGINLPHCNTVLILTKALLEHSLLLGVRVRTVDDTLTFDSVPTRVTDDDSTALASVLRGGRGDTDALIRAAG